MSLWSFLCLISLAIATAHGEVTEYQDDQITAVLTSDDTIDYTRGLYSESQPPPFMQLDDMLFTEETWRIWKSGAAGLRGITDYLAARWPKDSAGNTIVPYVIAANYTGSATAVTDGMNQWSSKTCVKFIPKSDPSLPAGTGNNWVVIQDPGVQGLCNSYIGNINRGGQPVNLGSGCDTAEVAAHELGHALGFGHEHQRSDRDNYLVVFPENIEAGQGYNFDKDTFSNYGVPYDFQSNMHYFWNAFSATGSSATMLPKDPTLRYLISRNNPVTHYDALMANLAFGCIDNWKAKCGTTAPVCKNYGYLSSTCTCVCPTGTSGADCSTLTATSLPQYPTNNCGGQINAEGNYTVPNMGLARPAGTDCVWQINAPVCSTAEITISNFKMYSAVSPYGCYFEALSIATTNLYKPDFGPFCGTDVATGTKYSAKTMVLYYNSNVNYGGGAGGFKFQVKFINDPTCVPTTASATTTTTTKAPTTTTGPLTTTTTTKPPTSTTTVTTKPPTTTTTKPTSTSTTKPTTTTTTKPPTTTTTKPTTTTTTKPTTTTTTKPTTSTTTKPTTTTLPTTTTFIPPSNPTQCLFGNINGTNKYYWISPNYSGLAPANSRCRLLLSGTGVNGFRVRLEDFRVTASSTACTNAYALIVPAFPMINLCNNQTGLSYDIASSYLYAQYQSNPTTATTGFKITFEIY